MRKVKYGRFVDFMPPSYDPYGMAGGHIYARHAEEESLKTAGYEYYIIDNGENITVNDATAIEKARARFEFLFNFKKKKVLGVRTEIVVNPYSDPNPQLGIRLDQNGNKEVDKAYYEKHEKRVINDNLKTAKDKIAKLNEIKSILENSEQTIESEEKSRSCK